MPSPMPPYSYSTIIRAILSASLPTKSVPISPAYLAGSPHYSPSSNKVLFKCISQLLLLLNIAHGFFPVAEQYSIGRLQKNHMRS
jgi:hypothetical protein